MNSVQDALIGKRILFIEEKTFIRNESEIATSKWAKIKKTYNVSCVFLILTSTDSNRLWAKKLQDEGLIDGYEATAIIRKREDFKDVARTLTKITEWLAIEEIQIDACYSHFDDLAPLKIAVRNQLGLPTETNSAIMAAILKNVTHDLVLGNKESAKFGVHTFSCADEETLEDCLEHVQTPLVMKTVAGYGTKGAKVVHSLSEAKDYFKTLINAVIHGGHHVKSTLFSQEIVVMEFLAGVQFAVEVIICQGKLIGGVALRRGTLLPPSLFITTSILPGCKSDVEHKEVIHAAYLCCRAIGLQNGIYDVDLMRTTGGIKLIEINPRLGGYEILKFIEMVYGIDLFIVDLAITCGAQLRPDDIVFHPLGCIVAFFTFADRDWDNLKRVSLQNNDQDLRSKKFVITPYSPIDKSEGYPVYIFTSFCDSEEECFMHLKHNLLRMGFVLDNFECFSPSIIQGKE